MVEIKRKHPVVNFMQFVCSGRGHDMAGRLNLKVLVLDSDFYALESLNSYLAWDRRTRVVALTTSMEEAVSKLQNLTEAELPNVILLEAEAFATPEALRAAIQQFCRLVPDVMIFCL